MSWHFSQALAVAFWEASSLGGAPSVPSKLSPTPLLYCAPDRMTAFSRLSRYGMTFAPLTADHGTDLLTWFQGASRVRTSALPEKGMGSTEPALDCGAKCGASLARFDPATSSWKTHQHSLFGGGFESLETLPPWGMIAGGELYPLPTPSGLLALRASITSVSGSGLSERVPTPNANDSKPAGDKEVEMMKLYHSGQNVPDTYKRLRSHVAARCPTPRASPNENRQTKLTPSQQAGLHGMSLCAWAKAIRVPTPNVPNGGRRTNHAQFTGNTAYSESGKKIQVGLESVVPRLPTRLPTPTAQDAKNNGPASQQERNTKPLNAEVGGPLNPPWVEWLMGWPLGWTDLKPLETDKFLRWLRSHGRP